MGVCGRLGKGGCQLIVDAAVIDMPGQHRFGVEALHDQDRFALLLDDGKIELGCESAIDGKFVFEDSATQFNGGEIEIRKFNVLLDLEGAVATEEYVGGMGFDMLDRCAGKTPRLALQKARIHHFNHGARNDRVIERKSGQDRDVPCCHRCRPDRPATATELFSEEPLVKMRHDETASRLMTSRYLSAADHETVDDVRQRLSHGDDAGTGMLYVTDGQGRLQSAVGLSSS